MSTPIPGGGGGVRINVVIHRQEINRMMGWNGEVGRSIEHLMSMTVSAQKALANRKSGHLALSIKGKKDKYTNGIGFETTADVSYALFVDQGTRPHVILPKRAGRKLKFFWAKVGRTVYLDKVSHPGTRAYRFMERGVEQAYRIWSRS